MGRPTDAIDQRFPAPDLLQIRARPYDHPDVVVLRTAAQRYMAEIYGQPDQTPLDAGQFAGALGGFVVGYLEGRPVATAGWRFSPYPVPGSARPAELKRVFVADEARRGGVARLLIAHLEDEARSRGADWMVLETGAPQIAAIGLYRRIGYVDIPDFGHYAGAPDVVSLGKPLVPASGRSTIPATGGRHGPRRADAGPQEYAMTDWDGAGYERVSDLQVPRTR